MVTLNNCRKHYKNFDLNITMQIPAGTVTGLIGRNGAGKSTTIKAILGLVRPDEGEVRVLDKNPRRFTPRDKEAVGAVIGGNLLGEGVTTETVIAIFRKMYRDFDETYFREKCEAMGLPLKKPFSEFSNGMKARLRILLAISHKAKLLVLDEPTAGMDVIARNEVLDLLREYLAQDSERSVLISSHISSDLEGFCDDVYLIDRGEIVLHEDTDTILGQYGVLKLSENEFREVGQQYIVAYKKEAFGYACLTKEKQYFIDNYPGIVVENGSLDSTLILMLGGKQDAGNI